MGHLLPTADRNTHLKIVAVAFAVVAVLVAAFSVRTAQDDRALARIDAGPVIKAGQPTSLTSAERAPMN